MCDGAAEEEQLLVNNVEVKVLAKVKILAKVLTKGFASVVDVLIGEAQATDIPNTSIHENLHLT